MPHTTANQCLKLVTLLYNKSQSGTRAVNTLNIIPITKRKFPKYFFQRLQIKADLRLSLQAFLSIGGGIVNRRSGGSALTQSIALRLPVSSNGSAAGDDAVRIFA